MNKNWIITALMLYLAALAVFGYLLLNRKSSETPTISPLTESTMQAPVKSPPQPPKKDYSYITKNDLFHPGRGKAPEDKNQPAAKKPGPPNRFKFDLRGVFRSGEQYGALISIGGNTSGAKGELKKANGEVFFRGAEVAEGYVLQEVNSNSVTILHNGEKIVIKLEKLQPPERSDEKENSEDKKNEDKKNNTTPRRPS